MASLTGQSIASSYEQLLHVDRDGGGNSTTLVNIKDGDNGTTFALQLATDKIYVDGSVGVGHDLSSHTQKLVVKNNASATTLTAGAMLNLVNEQGAGNTASIRFSGSQQNAFLGFFDGSTTATQRIAIGVGAGGTGDGHFNVTGDGNVGIGSSVPNEGNLVVQDSTKAELVIKTSASATDTEAALMFKTSTDTDDIRKKGGIIYKDVGDNGVGDMFFVLDSATDNGNATVAGNTAMVIKNSGDIGIGTASPAELLEVEKDQNAHTVIQVDNNTAGTGASGGFKASADGADLYMRTFSSSFTTSGRNIQDSVQLLSVGASGGFVIASNHATADMSFWTNDTQRLTIDGDTGNVGIGTAPDANTPLHIKDSTYGRVRIESTGGNSFAILYLKNDAIEYAVRTNGSDVFEVRDDTAGAVRLALDANSRISLANNDSGSGNTIFGYLAGENIEGTNTQNNTFIGLKVGYAGTFSSAQGNTGVGWYALNDLTSADNNVAVGQIAMENITSGNENVGVGSRALSTATTATFNVAVGGDSMFGIPAGQAVSGVVAIGLEACKGGGSTTTGIDGSVAVGRASLKNITTGSGNTAVGFNSAGSLAEGQFNTVLGYNAFDAGQEDSQCVAIGYEALTNADVSDTGSAVATHNTAVGYASGDVVTTGIKNTLIGSATDPSANSGTNQAVIGFGATGQADNSVTLGNGDVTRVYMSQDGDAEMYANGTINTSDKRLKEDISNSDLGLSFINKLRPVSYKFKNDKKPEKLKYGIIAQEVQEVLKESGNEDFAGITDKGEYLGADYVQFIAPLIKAVQELSEKVAELENK